MTQQKQRVKIVNPVFMICTHRPMHGQGENDIALSRNYLEAQAYALKQSESSVVHMFEIAREITFRPINTNTLDEGVEYE